MISRRTLLGTAASLAVGVIAGCGDGGGDGEPAEENGTEPGVEEEEGEVDDAEGGSDAGGGSLQINTDAFDEGGTIPESFTCDGVDESPPLTFEGVPDDAETLALIVDDPSAGEEPFVHWLLWNVPADRNEIPQGIPQTETVEELDGASQGTNDFDEIGYRGPCPPEGDDPHTYRFRAYALEAALNVEPGAEVDTFMDAIEENSTADAQTSASYGR
jgi:Raf kinase inhibitor-like YbhB/YbcL family protein